MRIRIVPIVVSLVLSSGLAFSSTPQLTSVTFPERESVSLAFTPTDAAPAKAKIKGSVKYEMGQAKISLSYDNMEPAILFGGDITTYVVWAVSRSNAPENLGELVVTKSKASGSLDYTTGKKEFALMITGEPYFLVGKPTDLVVATSAPADTKKIQGTAFSFDDFRAGPQIGVPSIGTTKYTDKDPVPLKQAATVLALAERLKADEANPTAMKNATTALGETQAAVKSKANEKTVSDAARRSISASAEALRDWGRQRDEMAAAKAKQAQAAQTKALEQKATTAEAQTAKTAQALAATEAANVTLAQQRDEIARQNAVIKQERDALAARLSGALGAVAETKQTARGTVTSLSGVLFDTGKTELKPPAKITLAKLAGVMLVFQKTTMQIEGYTDNVGSPESNLKLSDARAKAVRDFLESQGIASQRMTSVGKGEADPVAPNETPDGRSKNRRVEIISSEPSL